MYHQSLYISESHTSNKKTKVPFLIVLNPTIITTALVTKGHIPVLIPSGTDYEERSKEKDRADCALIICFRGKNQFKWQTLHRTESGLEEPFVQTRFSLSPDKERKETKSLF